MRYKFISRLRLFIPLIAAFFYAGTVYCQNTNLYNDRLKNASDSLEKVYIYHDIVHGLKDTSVDQAINYAKQALRLVNQINSPEARGATNELMGELFGLKNNVQPAINYYLISAKIYEQLEDFQKLSSIYGNLGMLYYKNNYDTERTLEYYRSSLDYAIKVNDQMLIGMAYNRIGGILFNQQNYTDALYYFKKANDIFVTINDKRNEAITLNNIGDANRMLNSFQEALSNYQRSIRINEEVNDIHLRAINFENIGSVYAAQKNFGMALDYYDFSRKSYEEINDLVGLAKLYILIADANLINNDIDGAFSSYQKAYDLSLEKNDWEIIKSSSLGLSKVYEIDKNYNKSLEFLRIHARYNDTLIKKQMSDRLFDLQSHFLRDISDKEIQIKDSQIDLLESEQRLNTLRQNLLIIGVITLIAISVITIINLRKRVKKQQLINFKDRQLHETQQELLRLELSNKANDLITFALHIVQKNDLLKQLRKELSTLSSEKDSDLNMKIKGLTAHVQQNLHINKEIEEFQQKVDNTYDDFFKKLNHKFPTLTKNERRLCVLLRLNLSTKEIASLNNISVKAVEMSRYRLRKKCGLDNKESIIEYMQSI